MKDKAETAKTGGTEMENMPSPALVPEQPPLPVEDDLMALARLGELRAIQKLFDSGKYTAASTDDQGITALHVRLSHAI